MSRHRLSILLITISLALLAVFLFWFLKKNYDQEVTSLQKETGYLFVNSIRSIEGEMLDKILFKGVDMIPDTLRKGLIDRRVKIVSDTVHSFSFVGERTSMMKGDSAVEVTISTKNHTGEISDMEGSMSIFLLSLDGSSKMDDSIFLRNDFVDVLGKMEKNFSATMEKAELPVQYQVVKIHGDTSDCFDLMGTGTYTDIVSGEKYGVELSGFNSYILKNILPQVLFSIGLFACVSLAFLTVFNSLQAQQRLTELKNDFIRNVTHELKTPIATVGVAIEALQDFDALQNPIRTKEYLDISKNELSRLSLLVDKVLQMSLFEKTAPELKLESVPLDGLTDEILTSMKLQFEKKDAEVNFNKEGENFTINGDRVHLASVVYNLLDNALKYGNEQLKIDVDLIEKNNQIILKVKDNGIGVAPEYQNKIFDKFFRVPTGDTHNVKGHGLGLSYVASVVQKHGGTINMESREGEGTTFIIGLSSSNHS